MTDQETQSRIDCLEQVNRELIETLKTAESKFREYAVSHLKKIVPDTEKSMVNAQLAKLCRDAINLGQGSCSLLNYPKSQDESFSEKSNVKT